MNAALKELNTNQLLEILQERNLQGKGAFRRTAIGYHIQAKQAKVINAILEHIVNHIDADDKLLKAVFPFTGWINNVELAEKMLKRLPDDAFELLSSVTDKKATALHCFPSANMIKFFLNQCIEHSRCEYHSIADEILLMKDEEGDNALHVACVMGNTEAMEAILDHEKIKPETKRELLLDKNTNGYSAYNRAKLQGHTDTVNSMKKRLPQDPNDIK